MRYNKLYDVKLKLKLLTYVISITYIISYKNQYYTRLVL